MLPSSLFPVSLERALLIGRWGRRGYVYTSACPPGKRQVYIGGSCFDKDSLGAENDKMVIGERGTLNGAGSFLTVGLWKREIAWLTLTYLSKYKGK